MTKLTLGSHPFLLGFDELERLVERTAKSGNDGYPPFNIEQTSENSFRITLAVAGFSEDDLSITIEDNQLVVRGRQKDDSDGRVYLHRGIAARQFQRALLPHGSDTSEAHRGESPELPYQPKSGLTTPHMAQKPVRRSEVGARAWNVSCQTQQAATKNTE